MRFLTRSKASVAVAILAGLVSSTIGLTPASASSPTFSGAAQESTVQDSQNATDEVVAAAIAKKFGHSVADTSKTTETSQVSALPDGSLQLVSNTLPVRVKQADGWVPVNVKLKGTASAVVPAATAVPVQFSPGGTNWVVKVQTSTGRWITESWPYGELPAPILSGATATYASVLPGVDLRLTATATGMSEVLVIKNATAAANPKLQTVELNLTGARLTQTLAQSTKASAPDNSTLVSSSPTWWDSTNPAAGPSGPGGDAEVQPVDQEVTASAVSLHLASIVALPDVKYPLYVDPDWSAGQQAFWFTDRAYPTTSYLNGQNATAGYQSVGAATASGKAYMSRAYWQFAVGALIGKQILAASFNVHQKYSVTGSGSQVQLWRYGPVGAGFTWNTDPGAWYQQLDSQLLPYGDSSHAASWVGMNAKAGVATVTGSGGGTLQLGLRSSNENDQSGRKHYDFGASLTVTYNSTPATPVSPQLTSPVRGCSTDPANPTPIDATQQITMQVNASDPDVGQNLETWFAVYGVTQPAYSWAQPSARIAGGPVSMTVPANTLALGDYRWQSQTNDGVGGVSPVSVWCYLRATTASPGLPTVSKTSTAAAVVGKAMTVTFGSAAADGVKLFAFWWVANGGTTPPAPPVITPIVPGGALPPCGSASGAVRFVCPDSGTVNATNIVVAPVNSVATLWVASYNDAGRVSLASSGLYAATGLAVIATSDTTGVSNAVGHIWDTQTITETATTVPDLNTTTGTSGTTTRQSLGAPLGLIAGTFDGIPTTVQSYATTSAATWSNRTAIDTLNSFTVSAWLYASPTASTSVAHVALSETSGTGQAFTLGTGVNGAITFCRTSQVNQAKTCAIGSNIVRGNWTLVTGVWDAANQSLRILSGKSIVANAVASQTVPVGDTSPDGWFCVGGSCTYNGSFSSAALWDGQIFRAAAFPGVISSPQLNNLYNVLSPNDDPPANQSIGAVINLGCNDLITPQNMYDYNPNFANIGWVPSAGTSAAKAAQWNGLACRWINETSNDPIDVSLASIVDRGTMVQLKDAASTGTPVPNLGDAAYFQTTGGVGELQVFRGSYWLTFRSPWFSIGSDADPLPADALVNLP